MSGVESGAIQSLRNNKNLRIGPGQRFKGSLYSKGYIGGVTRTKNKQLVE